MYFDLDMKKTLADNIRFRVDTELKGDSVGYGLNVAFHYKPTDCFPRECPTAARSSNI